jgi:hypothetical protein
MCLHTVPVLVPLSGASSNVNSTIGSSSAPSVLSTIKLGLDHNDFPTLGSMPVTSNNNSTATNGSAAQVTTSYTTHVGTMPLGAGSASGGRGGGGGGGGAVAGVLPSMAVMSGHTNSSSQMHDFTLDNFPVLGRNHHPQNQPPSQDHHPNHHHSHPPGLNGFLRNNEHWQNLM